MVQLTGLPSASTLGRSRPTTTSFMNSSVFMSAGASIGWESPAGVITWTLMSGMAIILLCNRLRSGTLSSVLFEFPFALWAFLLHQFATVPVDAVCRIDGTPGDGITLLDH